MAERRTPHRQIAISPPIPNDLGPGIEGRTLPDIHPAGEIKHSAVSQVLRMLAFTIYIFTCSIVILITQLIGAPLYWISKNWYYAYMALTKRSFGLVITTMTSIWSPTVIRVSGDASVANEIRKTEDGRLSCSFPDRMILVANHQLYTDWLYLWWVGYTNDPRTHGHLYIIAKESLKWLPIVGWGMQFYGFIFMSRKFSRDQPRMAYRLRKLRGRHSGPLSGSEGYDPMWLLLFPEGTNASTNGRKKSASWAEKMGISDTEHVLLPRSTGSFFCMNELKGSVDYVYDCTMAYEGVRRGEYGQDYFTLTASVFQGRPPNSVNLYWRRFAMSDIPLHSQVEFELWLRDRWYEKDKLMEQFMATGRFPSFDYVDEGLRMTIANEHLETEVRTKNPWEVLQIFTVPVILLLMVHMTWSLCVLLG